nr:F-box protein At5g07610-like [Ipomoea batatas]GMC93496.1 F-box protein At5g07610-like [Ipomoea batatas]GMC94894.1 F-box protein At5g07610-like [Ipomoea batatas]
MPCIPSVNNDPGWCKYFGECGGHLHFIGECGKDGQLLNVFEMENDYSRWVFKYQVDVGYVATFYPFVKDEFAIHLLLTLQEGKEEGEGLVISLPNGKDILWRLQDMSITQLESCNGITQRVYKRGYSTSKHIDTTPPPNTLTRLHLLNQEYEDEDENEDRPQ